MIYNYTYKTANLSTSQFFPLDEVQKRETYLWFENDELVGSIQIYHNKEENCYEVERVMVAPQSQGKGYGKKLLNFVVAKLQQTHRTPIVLTVATCNDKAVKMYEKFGFVPVSEEMDDGNRGGYVWLIISLLDDEQHTVKGISYAFL